jgi:hypothetical protein
LSEASTLDEGTHLRDHVVYHLTVERVRGELVKPLADVRQLIHEPVLGLVAFSWDARDLYHCSDLGRIGSHPVEEQVARERLESVVVRDRPDECVPRVGCRANVECDLVAVDRLDLERRPEVLHQGVVVGVADRPDRGADPLKVQVLGEPDRGVLRAGVGVAD